jgi:hypothetical protein
MYRNIQPESEPRLPLRMLFQPTGDGVFYRACEAGTFQRLVAALLDDPDSGDGVLRRIADMRFVRPQRCAWQPARRVA